MPKIEFIVPLWTSSKRTCKHMLSATTKKEVFDQMVDDLGVILGTNLEQWYYSDDGTTLHCHNTTMKVAVPYVVLD